MIILVIMILISLAVGIVASDLEDSQTGCFAFGITFLIIAMCYALGNFIFII